MIDVGPPPSTPPDDANRDKMCSQKRQTSKGSSGKESHQSSVDANDANVWPTRISRRVLKYTV